MSSETEQPPTDFDLDEHRKAAQDRYLAIRELYAEFVERLRHVLSEALRASELKTHSIQARAKTLESFGRKAATPNPEDPSRPKYADPLADITDLAGVRIITFFPDTVTEIERIVTEQFDVNERSDKSEVLWREERFGYQSVHFLVRLQASRAQLTEYARFGGLVAEIQVRTILQHAWAEIEHDIQYKSALAIPPGIRRRFRALAGLLEIADREFQAIQAADARDRQEARQNFDSGALSTVDVTPEAIKWLLDQRLGSDGRMSELTYDFASRMVRALGFTNLEQVSTAIEGFDDHALCRAVTGGHRGQVTRFELLLLASMGADYIRLHPWRDLAWFEPGVTRDLARIREAGFERSSHSGKAPGA